MHPNCPNCPIRVFYTAEASRCFVMFCETMMIYVAVDHVAMAVATIVLKLIMILGASEPDPKGS